MLALTFLKEAHGEDVADDGSFAGRSHQLVNAKCKRSVSQELVVETVISDNLPFQIVLHRCLS